jgi:hypothetical protein
MSSFMQLPADSRDKISRLIVGQGYEFERFSEEIFENLI